MAKDVHSGVKEYGILLERCCYFEKESLALRRDLKDKKKTMAKVVLSGGALKRQNANLLGEVSELRQQNKQLLRQLDLKAAKQMLLAKEEQINQAVRLQLVNLRESLSKLWTNVKLKRITRFSIRCEQSSPDTPEKEQIPSKSLKPPPPRR